MTTKDIHMQANAVSDSDMVPSSLVPDEDFTTDDKTELVHMFHAKEDMSVSSGVWLCAPCRQEFDAFPVNEMMHLLEGELTITASDGSTQSYAASDTLFVPQGAQITWEISRTLRKYFMASV